MVVNSQFFCYINKCEKIVDLMTQSEPIILKKSSFAVDKKKFILYNKA